MRPTSLVSRERAVTLVVCGHAQVIAADESVVYRSQHLRLALPVILQVPAYVELRPIVKHTVVRRVLFCRDNWRCAYCGRDGGPRDLTVDHVKPLSRGGEHAWTTWWQPAAAATTARAAGSPTRRACTRATCRSGRTWCRWHGRGG